MNRSEPNEPICHVELLGPLRVIVAGRTLTQFATQKTGALLAYLALRLGPIPRERVVDLLWPEMEVSAGRNNLSTTLVSLRRALEPEGVLRGSVLQAKQAEIGLNPDTVTTDIAQFEDLRRRAARTEAPAARAELLQRAVTLVRGDLLPGNYQDWALREAERLRARLQETLEQLSRDQEAIGELTDALETAQRLAALDPYSEENHCQLVRLFVLTGQLILAKQAQERFERLFAEEFGAAPSTSTRRIVAQLLAQPPPRAVVPALPLVPAPIVDASPYSAMAEEGEQPAARSVLPVVLGNYFGREAEIVRLARLIVPHKELQDSPEASAASCRLVTLTGPGGMGKTRLALEFAKQAAARFGYWCGFVSLADLTRPAQIPAQIASTLKVDPIAEGDPLVPICAFLNAQDRPGALPLLILDNLEHLLPTEETEGEDASAIHGIQTLLEQAPGLVILCTSRRRLGLRGEQVFVLTPLPVPETLPQEIGEDHLLEMGTVPSVRLYLDRAQAVRPDFSLTPGNAPAVAALCRQLEGSPLALELAAAWVRALPPRKMWERLTQGLDIPPGSYTDLPARHRTLSAALDWSFRLLTPAQARLFARLSVFRGGWTLEAAEAVCGEPDLLLPLTALQEASLVTTIADTDDEESARYTFLETVRTFSMQQAESRGEAEKPASAHAAFFKAFAEQADAQLRGAEQAQWLRRMEVEHDNLRAACEWCLSDRAGAEAWETGGRLAAALTRFWNVRGYRAEGIRVMDAALARADSLPIRVRAGLLNARAGFAVWAGDLAKAHTCYEASLLAWREIQNPMGISAVLHNMGMMALRQGEYARARPLYEESLALERERGDLLGVADALHHLGWLAHEEGDRIRARALYEESLSVRRPFGDLRGNAFTLQNLANIALSEEDIGLAQALQEENLAIRQELGDRAGTADALHNLGNIACQLGETQRGHALYREALILRDALAERRTIVESLENLAYRATESEQWVRAARLWGALTTLRTQTGLPAPRASEESARQACLLRQQAYPEEATAWQEGSRMTLEQAVAAALAEL